MDRQTKIKLISKNYAPSFQRRLEQMPDAQVAAIYERQLAAGKIKENK